MKYIPEDDFVKMLVDMHITDAMAMNHDINKSYNNLDSALLYGEVFKRYGYTYKQLKNTMQYYTEKPQKFLKIYNRVFATLTKMSDQSKQAYSSIQSSRTLEVWKADESRYSIFGDSLQYPPPFDFEVDTTGVFVLIAEVRMVNADESVNPVFEAYFYKPQDSISGPRIYMAQQPIVKSDHNRPREYAFVKEMKDPEFSRMRITIPLQENTDSFFMKGLEVRNLRLSIKTMRKQ